MNTAETDVRLGLALDAFLRLLCAGWEAVEELAKRTQREPNEVLADWAQANWETIVEAAISLDGKVFIEPYGEGADCNSVGSRVWMPGVASTHVVNCTPRSGNQVWNVLMEEYVQFPEEGYAVDRFATPRKDGWYAECPPFDHVVTTASGQDALFRLSDVSFVLRRL
jgi:hypothetical protein